MDRLIADRGQIAHIESLFRYADEGTFASLRTFFQNDRSRPPYLIQPVRINGNLDVLIDEALRVAQKSLEADAPTVFAPPIATFGSSRSATEADLANGLTLSTDWDDRPYTSRSTIERLLGPPTLVVASGSEWLDPKTGELQQKLHGHYRLSEPTRALEEHNQLRHARKLAAMLSGADPTGVPVAHPLRWPGSWHLKGIKPCLATVIALNENVEIHLDETIEKLEDAVEASGLGKQTIGASAGSPEAPIPLIRMAMEYIPNDGAGMHYGDWIRIGYAIHRACGGVEEAYDIWSDWSRKSDKYDPGETERTWARIVTAINGGTAHRRIGAGTIIFHARQNGWIDPRLRAAKQRKTQTQRVNGNTTEALFQQTGGDQIQAGEAEQPTAAETAPGEPDPTEAPPNIADLQAEIDRLSHLSATPYALERKAVAKRFGITQDTLLKAVQRAKGRRASETAKAARAQSAPERGEVRWPHGFTMEADGLYFEGGEEAVRAWVCSRLDVLGEVRDRDDGDWGLLLAWKDRDGRPHQWVAPRRLLVLTTPELEASLIEQGLHLEVRPGVRGLLREALNGVQCGDRVRSVERPGWHGPCYVLPDAEVIGASTEPLMLKSTAENARRMVAPGGTLEDWQRNVARLAEGNPVAAFCVSAALAGPLLDIVGGMSGGFHLVGPSKVGKTLAMRMGVSAWGLPRTEAALRSWKSTANGFEYAAEQCSDGLLPLDEIHEAEAHAVVGTAYQVANESGKQRLNRAAEGMKRRSWRLVALSTGEADIATIAAKARQPWTAGADTRFPSISLHGVPLWPELHGFPSQAALIGHLQSSLDRCYGTASRAFLGLLTAERGKADGGDKIRQYFGAILDRLQKKLPKDADPQVRDVARRCALVAAAGELATKGKVLPWRPGAAEAAAWFVLSQWIARRGGTGSAEEEKYLSVLRTFLTVNGPSRFVPLYQESATGPWLEREPAMKVTNRAGWRRPEASASPNGRDNEEFLIAASVWPSIFTEHQLDPTAAARVLKERKLLIPASNGKSSRAERIPGIGVSRVYVVRTALFDEGDAGA